MQYSIYDDEFSTTASEKIVFLCNNDNNTMMRIIIKNDTVQNVGLYDYKRMTAYQSSQKFAVNSDLATNLSNITYSSHKFVDYNYYNKYKRYITITTNKTEKGTDINVKKVENHRRKLKGADYDLHIKTAVYPEFTNTQRLVISDICGKRFAHFKPINKEVILESYFLVNDIKTEIHILDKIEVINFEINL